MVSDDGYFVSFLSTQIFLRGGLGFVVVLITGWTTDKYGSRITHYLVGVSVASVALIVLMATTNLVARYVMFFFVMFMLVNMLNRSSFTHTIRHCNITKETFFSILSRFIPISTMWAWLAQNVASSNKRAAATGLIFSMGNIGGAISGQIYRAAWAPRYVNGHAINLGCYVIAFVSGLVLWWSYRRDNMLRDKAAGKNIQRSDMLGEDLGDLGDRCVVLPYGLRAAQY
jgi:MFS family permease